MSPHKKKKDIRIVATLVFWVEFLGEQNIVCGAFYRMTERQFFLCRNGINSGGQITMDLNNYTLNNYWRQPL